MTSKKQYGTILRDKNSYRKLEKKTFRRIWVLQKRWEEISFVNTIIFHWFKSGKRERILTQKVFSSVFVRNREDNDNFMSIGLQRFVDIDAKGGLSNDCDSHSENMVIVAMVVVKKEGKGINTDHATTAMEKRERPGTECLGSS